MFTDNSDFLSSIGGKLLQSKSLAQTLGTSDFPALQKLYHTLDNSINSTSRLTGSSLIPSKSFEDLIAMGPEDLSGILDSVQTFTDPILNFSWLAWIKGENVVPFSHITAIQTPSLTFETKPIYREGKMRHYASSFSADDMSMTMYTDAKAVTLDSASMWFRNVMDRDGYYHLPYEYKKDIVLYLLDQRGQSVFAWTYVGCWPKSMNSYSLGQDSSVIMTELSLSVDDILFNF